MTRQEEIAALERRIKRQQTKREIVRYVDGIASMPARLLSATLRTDARALRKEAVTYTRAGHPGAVIFSAIATYLEVAAVRQDDERRKRDEEIAARGANRSRRPQRKAVK